MKKVYILLQDYDCAFGKICGWFKGGKYNHASIGLCESMEEFYSFRTKWGLCQEHPFRFNKHHKKEVPCLIYEVEVSEEKYIEISHHINRFWSQKRRYHYSYMSVFFGFIGIKHTFKNGYYCSKFVAEILADVDDLELKKHSSLYMPCDFENKKIVTYFEGLAKEFRPKVKQYM